jgi:hypothetical protein
MMMLGLHCTSALTRVGAGNRVSGDPGRRPGAIQLVEVIQARGGAGCGMAFA